MAIKVNGTTVIDDSRNLVNIASGLGGSPAGSIIYHAANTPPTGFIKANGASLSTTTYADLFAAIGYTYGGSGGSFNVPDLRGEFLRGWDDSRGVDSGRSFGSYQADEFKSHRHSADAKTDFYTYYGSDKFYSVRTAGAGGAHYTKYVNYEGGTETRPRNIALLACIKY
jgi:microcystin-dependent protein